MREDLLVTEAQENAARALALAEMLEDCVNLYMDEIAYDESDTVRLMARQTLGRHLSCAGCCSCFSLPPLEEV